MRQKGSISDILIRLLGGEDRGVYLVIALLADLLQFGLEVGIGEGAGVLEVAQTGIGEDVEVSIGNEGFEGTTAVVRFVMLCAGEPAEEVVRAVVERVVDEMMTVAVIGLAFAVNEYFSFTVEDLAHEDMT
jgi:hypothetical protein